MKKKIKVYIAGPYREPDRCINTNKAVHIGDYLLGYGFIPFIPHLCHFWHTMSPKEEETWIEYDLEWLGVCDCMFVLSGESKGVRIEINKAEKLNIPIFYDIENLFNTYKDYLPQLECGFHDY